MAALTVNELFCFVSHESDQLPRDFLNTTVHDFFSLEEATETKHVLISEYDKVCDPGLIKDA